MERIIDRITNLNTAALPNDDDPAPAAKSSYRAFQILRVGFTVIPIVAGAEKLFHLLVDWDKYLPPFVNRITGGRGQESSFAVSLKMSFSTGLSGEDRFSRSFGEGRAYSRGCGGESRPPNGGLGRVNQT
jgi:hypothetical protein